MSAQPAIEPIAKSWKRFERETHISHLSTKTAYDRAVSLADELLEDGAIDTGHDHHSLFMTLSDLIYAYDQTHYAAHDVSGPQLLRFLMDQHGLTQSQLPEIGRQSVVSEVLRGVRQLTADHIRKLSKRFGVSPAAFF